MSQEKLESKKNLRRQMIFRTVVLDNRPLRLKEIREYLEIESYDEEAARRDVGAFDDIGCRIQIRQSQSDPDDKELVFTEGPHTDNDTTRETINVEEKTLVARLAASIICGVTNLPKDAHHSLPSWMEDMDVRKVLARMTVQSMDNKQEAARVRAVLMQLNQKLQTFRGDDRQVSAQQILKLLRRSASFLSAREKALKSNLYGFWAETSRLVSIDSGTTNIRLAEFLKKLHIPLLGSPLCSLTVCTNSRRIFEVLGPSDVWVKTIIVGGQQMFRSPTIAGTMAELFLRSVSILQFGMCILGSTRVDLDRFAVCSDSQEESSIKNLLMDRSSLRVICVDNFKLQSGPGREGYRFASIDPRHIDLIITNSPFRHRRGAKSEYEGFLAKVAAIEARGVPVLVGTSSKTFDYPDQPTAIAPTKPSPHKRSTSEDSAPVSAPDISPEPG